MTWEGGAKGTEFHFFHESTVCSCNAFLSIENATYFAIEVKDEAPNAHWALDLV